APAKRAVALEVAGHLGVSDLTHDFLGLVAQRGRASSLPKMAEVFRELVDDELGRARAKVRTAVALTEADREALRQRLGRALHGKHVELDETVDNGLLGGFVAEVGSYIVDGSLDGQLARLRAQLAGEWSDRAAGRPGSRGRLRERARMIKAGEISEIIKRQLAGYEAEVDLQEIGRVIEVGDGIARVYGLDKAMAGELLQFPHDVVGMVLNLEQ